MRVLSLISLLSLSACAQPTFCQLYTHVTMSKAAAQSLVNLDRSAAETIVANNKAFAACR